MESLIEIKKELQGEYRTHIQVVSTSNFTHFILVGIESNRIPRYAYDAEMSVIKHQKVQRLSKKALQEYHQQGIEQAKQKYKDLI